MGSGGSVHCAWYPGTLLIAFWLAFWCLLEMLTRTIFVFCKHQVGKTERLYVCLVQKKTLQGLQGSAINKIP